MKRSSLQPSGHLSEPFRPVEIVGIDNGKRRRDRPPAGHKGMASPPWLRPPRGDRKSSGKLRIDLLKNILDGEMLFPILPDRVPKDILDLTSDDKSHVFEPFAKGPIERIVQEGFSARTDGVDLFQALVALADSRGEHKEAKFRHSFSFFPERNQFPSLSLPTSKSGSPLLVGGVLMI